MKAPMPMFNANANFNHFQGVLQRIAFLKYSDMPMMAAIKFPIAAASIAFTRFHLGK